MIAKKLPGFMRFIPDHKPSKIQYMIFKNPSQKDSALNLNIKDLPVGMTVLLKFLGITLGPHLKWKYLVRLNDKRAVETEQPKHNRVYFQSPNPGFALCSFMQMLAAWTNPVRSSGFKTSRIEL